MSSTPSVDDLELAVAVHRLGSVGAAARELVVTQPSASARLAALERRLGVVLFDRDTTGARATPAGVTFAAEAAHIMRHLSALPERTLAGAAAPLLRVATFPTLSAVLFPALDTVLAETGSDVVVDQRVDHGDRLIELIDEGSLDIGVMAIAAQWSLPRGVTRTPLGTDALAVVVPHGVPFQPRRTRPFSGVVPFHCVDMTGPTVARRIAALGGTGRRAATGEIAVLTARRAGTVALVSRAIAEVYRAPGDQILRSPVPVSFSFDAVSRIPVPDILHRIAAPLAAAMGLSRTTPRGS